MGFLDTGYSFLLLNGQYGDSTNDQGYWLLIPFHGRSGCDPVTTATSTSTRNFFYFYHYYYYLPLLLQLLVLLLPSFLGLVLFFSSCGEISNQSNFDTCASDKGSVESACFHFDSPQSWSVCEPTIPDSVQKEEPQVAGKPPAWKTWDKGQGFGTSRIDDPI